VRIPLNDLKRHHDPLVTRISHVVNRVLERGWYVLGPELEKFEAEFAAFCGTRHAVGVANGTDALELALHAVGVKPGDEVVTVANAGMYATTAILCVGATPVYADIEPDSMMMNATELRSALSSRTAAVIVTHLYGRMADIEALCAIAAQRGVPVIEDCAHAPGAERQGRRSGTWGMLGCFSFYPTKNLGAAGDAGAVVTSDAALAARLRALRQYGWTAKYHSGISGGRNSRLDEMQAAILRVQLPFLEGWNRCRREIAGLYCKALETSGLDLPRDPMSADYVAHLFVIRSQRRDEIRCRLEAAGIATDIHYPVPDYRQESVVGLPGVPGVLPETERCVAEVLTLPCFPEMRREEVGEVSGRLLAILG
jgi:dTDP-4-amino-4,6-dideoxygalactose transaminase